MEKLIELLNKEMEEQEKNWPRLARFTSYDGLNKVFNLNNGCCFWVEFVLSKRYEFIKWLVDNDKIEWSEKTAFVTFLERGINADKSDALVSLLAVKDNPIEFLISILK